MSKTILSLGLDVSLSCGYAVVSTTRLEAYGCIKVKPKDLRERLRFLTKEILKVINKHSPSIIVIEQVFHGPSPKTTSFLNKLQGAILVLLPPDVEVIFVNASSARKTVLGKGKHDKKEVFVWAKNLYDLNELDFKKDNDITDAILLAVLGMKSQNI